MFEIKKKQMFLLHFAGGNCNSYNFLKPYFANEFELISLELPGRGKRFDEQILVDFDEAVNDYVDQIKQLRNQSNYLIYGHSMGATLGLFVTKRMEEIFDAPDSLIVSGNAGPGAKEIDENGNEIKRKKRYLLNEKDFKQELRELGGIPDEILETKELYEFFSPIMRSDFQVLEMQDVSKKAVKLTTPIYAMMGNQEKKHIVIENWKYYTQEDFQYHIFEGNHFFITEHPKEIANLIMNRSLVSNVFAY